MCVLWLFWAAFCGTTNKLIRYLNFTTNDKHIQGQVINCSPIMTYLHGTFKTCRTWILWHTAFQVVKTFKSEEKDCCSLNWCRYGSQFDGKIDGKCSKTIKLLAQFYNEEYKSSELWGSEFSLSVPDGDMCSKMKPTNVPCDSNVCFVVLNITCRQGKMKCGYKQALYLTH